MGFPLRCCRSGKWIQNPSVQLPSCVRMDSTNSSHSSAERTSSNSSTGGSCGAPAVGGLSQLDCLDCHTCSLMKWHRVMAWDLNLSPVYTSFFVDGIWLWQYLVRTEGNRTHHAWMKVRWWFFHGKRFMHLLHGVSWVMIAIIINQIQVMASSTLVCLYYDKEIMDVTWWASQNTTNSWTIQPLVWKKVEIKVLK